MKILLHICCSNCALYPVKIFRSEGNLVTGYWFNPNIHPYDEYALRRESLKKIENLWSLNIIDTVEYDTSVYFSLFNTDVSRKCFPERCSFCYRLRLEKTAELAKKNGFSAFSTTLLISPYQQFDRIVETGKSLQEKYNISFYSRDFRQYFRDAMSEARHLGLYRQKYCGCIFSKEEREKNRRDFREL
jgi:hypothetical protein